MKFLFLEKFIIIGRIFPSIQEKRLESVISCTSSCRAEWKQEQDQEWNGEERREKMYTNVERRMRWLRIGPYDQDRVWGFFDEITGQAAEEQWVLIGQWYYFLYVHDGRIDLCRTSVRKGQPALTEVISPGQYAISDDDLECAVHYWTCGTYEPGVYRISPLIERKLRILFE
jgi:hypothetical protein